jgi:lysozyme family protein
MESNFDHSLKLVLKSEGGYVNNPKDPGGETMMGVTKKAWSTFCKRPIADGEMAKLTVADITPFYKALYWDKSYCNQLPTGIDYMVFDASVNMGVGQSIRLLQKSLGCVADGVIGPNTMKLINETNVSNMIDKYSAQKEQFYRSLALFNTFGKGWLNRVAEVKQNAKEMINGN